MAIPKNVEKLISFVRGQRKMGMTPMRTLGYLAISNIERLSTDAELMVGFGRVIDKMLIPSEVNGLP